MTYQRMKEIIALAQKEGVVIDTVAEFGRFANTIR